MRHPPEGVLRRLLDEPAGVPDADRRHVTACDDCRARLDTVQEDAVLVLVALAPVPGADVDLDLGAARQRLTQAVASSAPPSLRVVTGTGGGRRARAARGRPFAAGIAVAVVLAGAGAAAANDWLEIFRTERVVPVGLSTDDLNAVPDLAAYGDVAFSGDPDVHEVADAATAEAETGIDVPEVTSLPRGVDGEPTYRVGDRAGLTFTFSVEEATRVAAEVGEELPPPPPGADGSQVRLVAGPGVSASWQGAAGGPGLVVGRAQAPQAFSSSGVPFEALRDYLLSLPGLPPEVAAPLRTFNAEGSTLPLPVPAEHVTTSSAPVDGVDAAVLTSRDRSLAVVVWAKDGLVTVVAGPLDADEVLTVARSLR